MARLQEAGDTSKHALEGKVEGGLLTIPCTGAGDTHGQQDLITEATYEQFDLRWEWKIALGGNSGVKYFVLEDEPAAIGHEYQMIDDERHPDAKIGPHRQTAALYDVFPAHDRPMKPAGEWNTSEVIVKGTHVTHILNGKTVLEYDLGSPELKAAIAKSKFKDIARFGTLVDGHILVQDHGDQVWYRRSKSSGSSNVGRRSLISYRSSGGQEVNGFGVRQRLPPDLLVSC